MPSFSLPDEGITSAMTPTAFTSQVLQVFWLEYMSEPEEQPVADLARMKDLDPDPMEGATLTGLVPAPDSVPRQNSSTFLNQT